MTHTRASLAYLTSREIARLATAEEHEAAYHAALPPEITREVARLGELARQWRAERDFVAAGVLDRDAAALISMARDSALRELVTARLEKSP